MEGWIRDDYKHPGAGRPCHLSPSLALCGLTNGCFHLALVSICPLLKAKTRHSRLAPGSTGPGPRGPSPAGVAHLVVPEARGGGLYLPQEENPQTTNKGLQNHRRSGEAER